MEISPTASPQDAKTKSPKGSAKDIVEKDFIKLYESGKLDIAELRMQLKMKKLIPQIERKLQHFQRVFDLSSKLKPNATYSMVRFCGGKCLDK
jgi:hypothetical protein